MALEARPCTSCPLAPVCTSKMRKQKPAKAAALNHITSCYQNSNSDLPDFKRSFPPPHVCYLLLCVQALFLPELWGLPTAHPSDSSASIKTTNPLWILILQALSDSLAWLCSTSSPILIAYLILFIRYYMKRFMCIRFLFKPQAIEV